MPDARISKPPTAGYIIPAGSVLPVRRSSQQLPYYVTAIMAPRSLLYPLLLSLAFVPFSWALKFDLAAHMGHNSKYERCIRNFVAKDTLVLVTAIVDGQKGDGQMVSMHVSLPKDLG